MTYHSEHHQNQEPLAPEAAGVEHDPSLPQAPEAQPSHDTRLLRLLSLPEAEIESHGVQLRDVVERALATTINPHDRQALCLTAGIVEWRLLGQPEEPLPLGLVQGDGEGGEPKICYDTSLRFGYKCAKESLDKLNTLGLRNVYESLESSISEQKDAVLATCREIIAGSQTFQFIHALVAPSPQRTEEQPLSPFWYAVRTAQITQEMRKRWSMAPDERFVPYTQAYYELRGELTKLDYETHRVPTRPNADPLARLRSYLNEALQEALAQESPESPGETITGFGGDDEDKRILTDRQPTGIRSGDTSSLVQAASHASVWRTGEAGMHTATMVEEWLYYLTLRVMWSSECPQDFKAWSDEALDEALAYLKDCLHGARRLSALDYEDPQELDSRIHAGLTKPQGSYLDLSRLPEDRSRHHIHESLQGDATARIVENPDVTLGKVLCYPATVRGPHAYRLLQQTPADGSESLPELAGDEELVLQLFDQRFEDSRPYIPGFRLAGRTADSYGFRHDPTNDPYAAADIQLSTEQRFILAGRYANIGLTPMSKVLERRPGLTVQDLASLLVAQSVGVDAKRAEKMTPPIPTNTYLEELADCKEIVRRNKLYMQCSGAGHVLALSLNEIFDDSPAYVVTGYELSRRTISTTARHAQTVFTHEGRIYMLDATPYAQRGGYYRDALIPSPRWKFWRRPNYANMAAGRTPPLAMPSPQPDRLAAMRPTLSRKQKVQNIRKTFDTQLAVLLEAQNTDAVYEKVVQLPVGDPFRSTLEAVLVADMYDAVGRDQLTRLQDYLKNYLEAGIDLRRNLGAQAYDDPAIQFLCSTVARLLEQY